MDVLDLLGDNSKSANSNNTGEIKKRGFASALKKSSTDTGSVYSKSETNTALNFYKNQEESSNKRIENVF